MKRTKNAVIIILLLITPLIAGQYSGGQRETGEVILNSLTIKSGMLSFRTESGGCTDKKSFRVNVEPGRELPGYTRHYILTITRIIPDDCKALLDDGVVIEYDLEKDLGLKGNYAVSVKNTVTPRNN